MFILRLSMVYSLLIIRENIDLLSVSWSTEDDIKLNAHSNLNEDIRARELSLFRAEFDQYEDVSHSIGV